MWTLTPPLLPASVERRRVSLSVDGERRKKTSEPGQWLTLRLGDLDEEDAVLVLGLDLVLLGVARDLDLPNESSIHALACEAECSGGELAQSSEGREEADSCGRWRKSPSWRSGLGFSRKPQIVIKFLGQSNS